MAIPWVRTHLQPVKRLEVNLALTEPSFAARHRPRRGLWSRLLVVERVWSVQRNACGHICVELSGMEATSPADVARGSAATDPAVADAEALAWQQRVEVVLLLHWAVDQSIWSPLHARCCR